MELYKNFVPAVSIILPTFNRAYIIERAIYSVIKQTSDDWELLIVDDGSEDNTFDICNKFISQNSKIRYLRHNNRKLPISLNVGIKAAAGKFITFIGSDDEYMPKHLKLRINYFEKHSNVELIHGGVKIIGDNFVKDKNDLSKRINLNNCVIGGTFFGKKEVFEKLNGFKDIEYSEDSDFFERAKFAKVIIEKVNFQTYIYHRDTKNGICNSF